MASSSPSEVTAHNARRQRRDQWLSSAGTQTSNAR